MLPPHIIEHLRERERARQEEAARPQPRLEIPTMGPPPEAIPPREPEEKRGVAIIDVF